MKTIYLVFLSLLLSTTICSQTTNTSTEKSIEQTRQDFWNNIPPNLLTNDFEELFTIKERENLNSILRKFDEETSIEISIVTLDASKIASDKITDLTQHLAETWQLGKKDKKNGILIAISKNYRIVRIQYGADIEKIITDVETKNLMNTHFAPEFKKGNYYNGTLNGLNELITLLKSKESNK